jgi:hypothetical protein
MSKERIEHTGSFPAIFAGAGMGLLVGLIIGMSVSPVVQVILGALASLLGAFLGLQDGKLSGQETEGEQNAVVKNRITSLRVGSFGFAVALGILCGIYFRTHDVLSMSVEQQVKQWTNAGYTPEEARKLVAFQKLGINPQTGAVEAVSDLQKKGVTALYNVQDHAEDLCSDLNPELFGYDVAEILIAYRNKEDIETFTDLADIIERIPADKQLDTLQALWEGICELAQK